MTSILCTNSRNV